MSSNQRKLVMQEVLYKPDYEERPRSEREFHFKEDPELEKMSVSGTNEHWHVAHVS
jgi:hypothetical protein